MAGRSRKASGPAPGAMTRSPRASYRPAPGLTAHPQAEDASAALGRGCSPGSVKSGDGE